MRSLDGDSRIGLAVPQQPPRGRPSAQSFVYERALRLRERQFVERRVRGERGVRVPARREGRRQLDEVPVVDDLRLLVLANSVFVVGHAVTSLLFVLHRVEIPATTVKVEKSMSPKIAACLIVRNAEATLERCLSSIRPFVNEINVYDTGSRDSTLDLLERMRAQKVVEVDGEQHRAATVRVQHGEWCDDFAWAREQSFAMVSNDIEWLLWLDADDEVEGAEELRSLVAHVPAEVDGFLCYYDVERDESGNTASQRWRERLVRRSAGFLWRGAVHEVLVPADGRPARLVRVAPERIRWVHHHLRGRWDPNRNLDILLAEKARSEAAGQQLEARTLFYLAGEYMWRGAFAEATPHLESFLDQIGSEWSDERVDAVHKLAACLRLTGRVKDAIELELDAFEHRGDWCETALGLAGSYAALENWSQVEHWARRAHELGVPDSPIVDKPLKLAVLPLVRLAEAALILGKFSSAQSAFADLIDIVGSSAGDRNEFERIATEGDRAGGLGMLSALAARYDEELHAFARGLRLEGEARFLAADVGDDVLVRGARGIEALVSLSSALGALEEAATESRAELQAPYAEYTRKVSTPLHAISLELGAVLLSLCRALRPRTILDLGSGFSSLVFRLYASDATPRPSVTSVDDSPEWLEKTRAFLSGFSVPPDNLLLWADFLELGPGKFDLVLHDIGDMHVRGRTLSKALGYADRGGLVVLDDIHIRSFRARAEETLAAGGFEAYDLRPLTLDAYGRFAVIVRRQ
jgi:predicted O-methyltransferase YrrM